MLSENVCGKQNLISPAEIKNIEINMLCTARKGAHNNKSISKEVDIHFLWHLGTSRKYADHPGAHIVVLAAPCEELLLMLFFRFAGLL